MVGGGGGGWGGRENIVLLLDRRLKCVYTKYDTCSSFDFR